jgi:hypothetical protein
MRTLGRDPSRFGAQDFACGLPLGQGLAHARKTAQHRSLGYARDFGSRLGRRESASAQGPSTSLRISARGSDAAKTPQLYKKQALIRLTVNALDFTGVRCLRIVYGLISIRKPCSLEVLLERGGAEARRKTGLSPMSSRTPPTHTSPSADWLRSGVLMLLDFFACGYEIEGVFSCQRTAYARLLGAGEKQPAFPLIVYILYLRVSILFQKIIFAVFSTA